MTPLTKMMTDAGDSKPVSQKPYPTEMKHNKLVKDQINKLLTANVIQGSQSSQSASIRVVPKGLMAGYHHILLDESSILKTAFTSPFRKYERIKVPFGLTQTLAYFQELMTDVLKDFPFAIAYLDDIIIFSRTAQEHLHHIRHVFEKLQTAHLSMKLSKCHFFAKEIQYLGHILSTMDIRPLA